MALHNSIFALRLFHAIEASHIHTHRRHNDRDSDSSNGDRINRNRPKSAALAFTDGTKTSYVVKTAAMSTSSRVSGGDGNYLKGKSYNNTYSRVGIEDRVNKWLEPVPPTKVSTKESTQIPTPMISSTTAPTNRDIGSSLSNRNSYSHDCTKNDFNGDNFASRNSALSEAAIPTTTPLSTTSHDDKSSSYIRDATHDDYSSVLTIDEGLYMGRDYLPYTYHRALEMSNTKAVVCQESNDVIGYAAGHLVDDGQTLVLSSGRVKSSRRSQGHTKRMLEEIRNHFRRQGRKLKQEVLVTKGTHLMQTKASFHEEYTEVLRKSLVNFIIPKSNHLVPHTVRDQYDNHIMKESVNNPNTVMSRLGSDEATTMLSKILSDSFALKKELFGSSDFLITNWTPYGVSPENSEDILKSNDVTVLSRVNQLSPKTLHYHMRNEQSSSYHKMEDGDERKICTKLDRNKIHLNAALCGQMCVYGVPDRPVGDEKEPALCKNDIFSEKCKVRLGETNSEGTSESDKPHMPPILSFGNYFPCKLGMAYNVDLYFTDNSDQFQMQRSPHDMEELEAVAHHMSFHVKHAVCQDVEKSVHLIVFVSSLSDYQRTLVCNVMNSWFGLKPAEWDTKHLHLYRRSLS